MNSFDSAGYANNEMVLNDMYEKFNTIFYDNNLYGASMTIDVIHGRYNYRFAPGVIKTPSGIQSDEIAINGSIIVAEEIEKIAMNILAAQIEQWEYHQNEMQLLSRGKTYKNDKYKEFAETHGLVVEICDDGVHRWEVCGITDTVKELIKKYRWSVTSQREQYTYGDSNSNRKGSHRQNALCPSQCNMCKGQILGASRAYPERIVCLRYVEDLIKRIFENSDGEITFDSIENALNLATYSSWSNGSAYGA